MTRWQRLRCVFGWHDRELRLKPDESMVLRCVSCGDETPGWTTAPSRRVVRILKFQRRLRDARDTRGRDAVSR